MRTFGDRHVIGLMKRNGAWQAKSESQQEGWLRHMHEEHVTPEEVGRLAAQPASRQS